MGPEIIYEFFGENSCPSCNGSIGFTIIGSEYAEYHFLSN